MEEMNVVESNRQTVSMYKWYSKVDEAKKHAYYWFHHMAPQRLNVATPLWPSVGVKPNTSKVGDLESSGTLECLEFDSKAQNTSMRS
jgi:hypothetical protein